MDGLFHKRAPCTTRQVSPPLMSRAARRTSVGKGTGLIDEVNSRADRGTSSVENLEMLNVVMLHSPGNHGSLGISVLINVFRVI